MDMVIDMQKKKTPKKSRKLAEDMKRDPNVILQTKHLHSCQPTMLILYRLLI